MAIPQHLHSRERNHLIMVYLANTFNFIAHQQHLYNREGFIIIMAYLVNTFNFTAHKERASTWVSSLHGMVTKHMYIEHPLEFYSGDHDCKVKHSF